MKKEYQNLNIRLTVEQHRQIKIMATKKGISIKELILSSLNKKEKDNEKK